MYLFTYSGLSGLFLILLTETVRLFSVHSCVHACVHSVFIHDTPTFFTPGTTGPPPVRHRQATRHKHHGGQAAQAATARDAKRPNCQGQGPQGKAPQALHLNLADGRVRRATCVPRAASRLCTAGTRCARTHARTHARRTRPHLLLHAHN